jgi:hypothetical protein
MASQPTVRFIYREAAEFRRVAVSGVIGGMTPAGLLLANLFFERHRFPAEQTANVRPDGTLEPIPPPPETPTIDRDVLVGLQMTPETALSIAAWLKDTAEAALAARAAQSGVVRPN